MLRPQMCTVDAFARHPPPCWGVSAKKSRQNYAPKASAVHTKSVVVERPRVTCLLNTDTILRQVAAHLHHIGARCIWSGLNAPLHIAPLQHQTLSL